MDHKEFFEKWGNSEPVYTYATNEELYQAFKQRLIEELRCGDLARDRQQLYLETWGLVDITEESNTAEAQEQPLKSGE